MEHPNASYVFLKAVKAGLAPPTTESLSQIPASDARWPPTWLHLAKAGVTNEEHWRLGINWIRDMHSGGSHDQQLWPAIWVELWRQKTEDPALQDLGCAWFQTHLESEGWPSVWLRLRILTQHRQVTGIALGAFKTLGLGHNKWAQVWERLWTVTSPNSQERGSLVAPALKWLVRHSKNDARTQDWNAIWQMLRDAGQQIDQLDKLAFENSESKTKLGPRT